MDILKINNNAILCDIMHSSLFYLHEIEFLQHISTDGIIILFRMLLTIRKSIHLWICDKTFNDQMYAVY